METKKIKDWKYKILIWMNVCEVVAFLGIVYFSVNYSYWLLFLILLLGSSNSERRILGIPEKD